MDYLIEAAKRIIRARDYYADTGAYPPEYGIEAFDDWAADLSEAALEMHSIKERLPLY